MRLAVLSRGARLYSTRRLVQEARNCHCEVDVLDPLQFSLSIGKDEPQILHRGSKISYDSVLPRIGHSITAHGVALLRQFERLNVYTTNPSFGIRQSRDKLLASQILSANNIPIPTTIYVRNSDDVEQAVEKAGGLPVVIKVSQGTQGRGVFLRHTMKEAKALVEALLVTGQVVLVQQYVQESHGTDIRVLVVGDKVVAAMRRRARGREFRSNYHLNGTVENVDLPEDFAKIAVKASKTLGLKVAGVDLLEGNEGPLVLEINSSPGLEGIERASKVNVAREIIEFIIEDSFDADVDLEDSDLIREDSNETWNEIVNNIPTPEDAKE